MNNSNKQVRYLYDVLYNLANTGVVTNVFGLDPDDNEIIFNNDIISLLRDID